MLTPECISTDLLSANEQVRALSVVVLNLTVHAVARGNQEDIFFHFFCFTIQQIWVEMSGLVSLVTSPCDPRNHFPPSYIPPFPPLFLQLSPPTSFPTPN
ncbi:hypothetical protein K443DRAFT_14844 [Laccaria amethystina LaAM-08-1]|uniref:Unplaced genomic scaffold K443scaffold_551, whole genome shotgun sequence n=1 Tax=Laccaria amethystina LaAM-08-1 TaxID=1095629 RepID=A0A0C9WM72_9AGAR|nr:hypothetical protein K443DRAFT_14844 [Laccaria amethystina LaAM-08-1]